MTMISVRKWLWLDLQVYNCGAVLTIATVEQEIKRDTVVPEEAMAATSSRGNARLSVSICFGTSAGRAIMFELTPEIINQVSAIANTMMLTPTRSYRTCATYCLKSYAYLLASDFSNIVIVCSENCAI
jgi:hypothetical protein